MITLRLRWCLVEYESYPVSDSQQRIQVRRHDRCIEVQAGESEGKHRRSSAHSWGQGRTQRRQRLFHEVSSQNALNQAVPIARSVECPWFAWISAPLCASGSCRRTWIWRLFARPFLKTGGCQSRHRRLRTQSKAEDPSQSSESARRNERTHHHRSH